VPFVLLFVSAVGARKRLTLARLSSVMARTVLLAIPIAILAGPIAETTTSSFPRLEVLMDASRSVPPAARAAAEKTVLAWTRDQALTTVVVDFGTRPRLATLPAAEDGAASSRAAADRDLESDPNPAAALLRLLDPGGAPPAVAMFTDGAVEAPRDFVATGANALALVVPAAAGVGRNVRLDHVRAERGGSPEEPP
jgi:hypothetical protein